MSEVWLPLALIAVCLYGTSQVAQKFALNEVPAPSMVTLSLIIAIPIYTICLLPYLVSGEILEVNWQTMLFALAAAAFGQIGYYTYLEAAERGPISLVGSVTASYPMMVVVVAILFLSEAPTIVQLFGVFLVTASMVVLTYIHGGRGAASRLSGGYFMLCIVTLLLWGFWAIFTKVSLDDMPALLFLGLYAIVIGPITLAYYNYKGLRMRDVVPSWSVALIIAIIASEVANLAFFCEITAASLGPASIVFPLVAASPVVVVVLAFLFLRERLSRKEWMLITAVMIGIVLVSTV
ncbi:MAG TPA: DMT family transporter [Thermoplasmata archaeon]|nr:DMT family transporter [Thermoplasmata archaeon]